MKKTPHKKSAVPALHVNESVSLEEQVAQRARELWHRRGYHHGADLADWFQAEREVNEWHQQRLRNSAPTRITTRANQFVTEQPQSNLQ